MTLTSVLSGRSRPGTGTGEAPAPADRFRRWNRLMVLAPALVLLVAGWQRRWISDDGLIFTRTVRQILAGNGPVFNVGERAEASTSTLWQWLLVGGGHLTGMDIGRLAVFLGLICAVAGYVLALDGTRRLYGPWAPGKLLLPAGVVVLLALPPVWDFATSGLETGLTTLWTGACWWLLVRSLTSARRRVTYALAFLAGLGPLVRPDLALGSLAFLGALMYVRRPRWRSVAGMVAVAGAVPVAYEVFRAGYYGVLLPLPAITKEASSADWARGRGYLGDLVEPYRLWLPLLLLAVLVVTVLVQRGRAEGGPREALADRADRARLVVAVAPVLCGAALVTYVVRVGGDFMHARMLLPGLFFLLLPVLLVPAGRLAAALVAAATVWAVVCAMAWRVPYTGVGERGIADERDFYTRQLGITNPVTGSAYLLHYPRFPEAVRISRDSYDRVLVYPWHDGFFVTPLSPGTTAGEATVWPNLGMNGAAVSLRDGVAVDVLGLAYPLAAHVELTERGRPGHEKELDIAWVFADLADPSVALPAGLDPLRVAAARYALTCGSENRGAIKELQDSVREPMSWKRFWKNLTGAPKRTTYRFPNDPVQAMKEVCGVDEVPEDFLHQNPWLDPARHNGGAS